MLQWKLRRLAARVLRVLERHAGLDPALGSFQGTLGLAAQGFIDTYDGLRALGVTADRELAQGKQAVELLGTKLISYSAQIEATGKIEGFKRTDYDGAASVPDDVISDAEVFVDVVKRQVDDDPESLPMAQSMLDDMVAALEAAKKEWAEADGLRADYRALLEQNRENAKMLSGLLVAFRKALGRILGRAHPDYQTLRANKVDRMVLEEGEEEGLPEHLLPPPAENADVAPETPETEDEDLAEAG